MTDAITIQNPRNRGGSTGHVLAKRSVTFTEIRTEGERFQPDVLIRLPGDKQVVVDAKVSLTAYQQYIAADDDLLRQQALKQHVT
ncbi:DNA recombination protein RmuC, partial [Leclercia tamurae]|nr:DNA recombination protein RmuC [Leclercia tamurae]